MSKHRYVASKVFNFNKLIVVAFFILIINIFYIQTHKDEMEKEYSLLFELKSMQTLYQRIDSMFDRKIDHQSFDEVSHNMNKFSKLLSLLDGYSIFEPENESTDFSILYKKLQADFDLSKSYIERYNSWNSLTINSTRAIYDVHIEIEGLIHRSKINSNKEALSRLLDSIMLKMSLIHYNGLSEIEQLKKRMKSFKEGLSSNEELIKRSNTMSKHVRVLSDGYELMAALKEENEKLRVGETINTIHAHLLKNLKKKDQANRINIYALNLFILLLLVVLFLINKKEAQLHAKVYGLNRDLQNHVQELEDLSYTLEERVFNRTKELEQMVGKVEKLSVTDELTGLYNRRYYTQIITTEIKRAKREKVFFGYLILDVDNFKLYNDNYGHQNGDTVLKEVSNSLSKSLARPDDFVFRIGGEEFVIIFTSKNKDKSVKFANKIIDNVKALKIKHEFNESYGVITLSAGLVIVDPNENITDEDVLYQQSDKLLYQAKESGRNCVKS